LCDARRVPVAGVETGATAHGQALKLAPFGQLAGYVGQEAVEQALLIPVFGEIGDQRAWIDGDGLVTETAHGFERDRLDQPGRISGHLENITMLGKRARAGIGLVFLASQPGAPGRRTACAIIDGTDKRQVFVFYIEGFRIQDQVAGPTDVGIAALIPIMDEVAVNEVETGIVQAEWALVCFVQAEFVIANQDEPTIGPLETGHAVKITRDGQAVTHRLAGRGDHVIGEAPRQVEQPVRINPQLAEALDLIEIALLGRIAALAGRQGGKSGKGEGGRGAIAQEMTAGQGHWALQGRA